eukprot:SAG31_NODE_36154_length_316_cov_0.663594_1_plen_35_part_01
MDITSYILAPANLVSFTQRGNYDHGNYKIKYLLLN